MLVARSCARHAMVLRTPCADVAVEKIYFLLGFVIQVRSRRHTDCIHAKLPPPACSCVLVPPTASSLAQASRLLADPQGSSVDDSQGLLAAKRRLAYAGSLHWRLGSMCTEFGCASRC